MERRDFITVAAATAASAAIAGCSGAGSSVSICVTTSAARAETPLKTASIVTREKSPSLETAACSFETAARLRDGLHLGLHLCGAQSSCFPGVVIPQTNREIISGLC